MADSSDDIDCPHCGEPWEAIADQINLPEPPEETIISIESEEEAKAWADDDSEDDAVDGV